MKYFDSHTHLQFSAYNEDREETLQNALQKQVGMINVGTLRSTSEEAIKLARERPDDPIYATVGIHPTHATSSFKDGKEVQDEYPKDGKWSKEFFKDLCSSDKVVAVGECGLDYFRMDPDDSESKKRQERLFKKHIELAKEEELPLMVHCRPSKGSQDAYEDLYEILKPEAETLKEVIIHFFVGDSDMADKFLDLDFKFTFGGVTTFTDDYNEAVKHIPIENILLETDAPYVAPKPHRGKRNEPAYVIKVYKAVSEIKNTAMEELQRQMIQNNEKVFGLNLE